MAYPYYTEPTHDTGTAAVGARDTTISNAEGRLRLDVVDKVFLLEPTRHPLVTLLTQVGRTFDGQGYKGAGLQKAVTINPEFKWLEDYYGGRYAKVVGTYTAATTACTITVTGAGSSSGYIFTPGDIVRNFRTGENMLVDTVSGATTITIATAGRGFGTTAAAQGADGDGLFIIGNVNAENAGARNVNTTRSAAQTNYTQIFRRTMSVSGTEKASGLYGPKDLPYLRAKLGTEHLLDIERAMWFGEKKIDTSAHPKRATGGVLELINSGGSYVQNQDGILTAPDFNTFLREGFTYGNPTKMLFAGGLVIQAINEMARGQMTTKPLDQTYGIRISEYVTPFGVINIVHNTLFVEDYAGYAFLLDLECFRYRYMEGRDTQLHTNIQAPDVDGEVDEYLTECGLERKQAPRHALLKGVEG